MPEVNNHTNSIKVFEMSGNEQKHNPRLTAYDAIKMGETYGELLTSFVLHLPRDGYRNMMAAHKTTSAATKDSLIRLATDDAVKAMVMNSQADLMVMCVRYGTSFTSALNGCCQRALQQRLKAAGLVAATNQQGMRNLLIDHYLVIGKLFKNRYAIFFPDHVTLKAWTKENVEIMRVFWKSKQAQK